METPRAETFRKLLERDPDNPMILCSLGIELFKEGRYLEAREHLARAVENKPDYSVAYRMLGRTHYELHENAEARRGFPKSPALWESLRESAKVSEDPSIHLFAVGQDRPDAVDVIRAAGSPPVSRLY